MNARKRFVTRPATVAGVAVLLYLAYVIAALFSGVDARQFVVMGRPALAQSHVSAVIRFDPHARFITPGGYDGQFAYYIALDPSHARAYMDGDGAYRYARILYPMLARLLAMGQVGLVPYTLLLLNLLGVGLGVWALAAWLARAAVSPWPALLYALYPGTFVSVTRDLADSLSLAFVALAVYLHRFGGRHRLVWAAGAFALAGLTRETTLVLAAVYALWVMRERSVLVGLGFGFFSALPLVLWKSWLFLWLGSSGMPRSNAPVRPFFGLAHSGMPDMVFQLAAIVLPSLIAATLILLLLRRGLVTPEMLVLLMNVLLFVILLNPSSYADIFASARIAGGVPLFALFCLPRIRQSLPGSSGWWRLSWLFWLAPLKLLLTDAPGVGQMVPGKWLAAMLTLAALFWFVLVLTQLVTLLRAGVRFGLGRYRLATAAPTRSVDVEAF